MSDNVFNAYSRYYDLLYQDKDYPQEAAYITHVLNRHGIINGGILEFGSGTGKHGRLLVSKGFSVHGIERSADMVALAEKVNGFTCQTGDICTVQLDRRFDAVLSLFHVISYQTSNVSLCQVFTRASEHLKKGGLFTFDFWYSPAVYSQSPTIRVKRMENEKIKIIRLAEPTIHTNENRVDVNYTIFATDKSSGEMQTIHELHSMRHFTLPEIDLLAGQHGFIRIDAEEFLTGAQPSEATWGVCVTLKRI